jgi:hypothetical protein
MAFCGGQVNQAAFAQQINAAAISSRNFPQTGAPVSWKSKGIPTRGYSSQH